MTDILARATTVTIGKHSFPFTTSRNASAAYRKHIGNKGASQVRNRCLIFDDRGEVIAHVSFNGRVWAGADYDPTAVELTDS